MFLRSLFNIISSRGNFSCRSNIEMLPIVIWVVDAVGRVWIAVASIEIGNRIRIVGIAAQLTTVAYRPNIPAWRWQQSAQ